MYYHGMPPSCAESVHRGLVLRRLTLAIAVSFVVLWTTVDGDRVRPTWAVCPARGIVQSRWPETRRCHRTGFAVDGRVVIHWITIDQSI